MKNSLTYHGNEISIISITIRTLNASFSFCYCVVRMSVHISYRAKGFSMNISQNVNYAKFTFFAVLGRAACIYF